MIDRKTWADFRGTGLAVFVNQFLHLFGWAIVWEQDEQGNITNCYPARCKFRGFDAGTTDRAYKDAATWIRDKGQELYDEADY